MKTNFSVLIAGSNKHALDDLAKQIRSGRHYAVSIRHISNGHADPLYSVRALPDVLILHLAAGYEQILEALAQRPPNARPRSLVVGPAEDVEAMRLAMRAGATDYIAEPAQPAELLSVLTRFREEADAAAGTPTTWTVVMNAKGGSGASFLACNLAHMMAETGKDNVALIDLDIQFGSLATYLDLEPRHTLMDAIEAVHELDSVALTGFMEKHAKRLHVLAASQDRVALPEDVPQQSLDLLLELIASTYRHVVVDAPRQVNHLTATTIERADNVLLVMQQSVACLQEAVRLTGILSAELGVQRGRISVVVNRYQKNLTVGAAHIERSLKDMPVIFVPNDFRQVMESVDVGSPIYEHSRNSTVTRTLMKLQRKLTGDTPQSRMGLLGRSLANLLGAT